ncbi:MAG: histidine kinase [Herbiconiux sp.]|nr:histidine kinase [Herbiconiux sp.]
MDIGSAGAGAGARAEAGSGVRGWGPELGAGAVVLGLGAWEAASNAAAGYEAGIVPWAVVVGTAGAVALVRRRPWVSFGVLWALLVLQLATATDVMIVQLATALVAFGLARWGSRAMVWASAASLPVVTVVAFATVSVLAGGMWGTRVVRTLIVTLAEAGIAWPVVVLPAILCLLTLPWLAGLTARYRGDARSSERSQAEAEQAAAEATREGERLAEIAALRESQARLARDVHDVVGHSLTVILAQAESAQFLAGDDPEALRATMATIARSARSSLQDVRAVLSTPEATAAHHTDLDDLVDATRASGHDIVLSDHGSPRPLPPEIAAVAFRVLQEMLTNALKHGRRDAPVRVRRTWGDELQLTVSNRAAPAQHDDEARAAGSGLPGIRRRLDSVGGRVSVDTDAEGWFVVTAALPVRAIVAHPVPRI